MADHVRLNSEITDRSDAQIFPSILFHSSCYRFLITSQLIFPHSLIGRVVDVRKS